MLALRCLIKLHGTLPIFRLGVRINLARVYERNKYPLENRSYFSGFIDASGLSVVGGGACTLEKFDKRCAEKCYRFCGLVDLFFFCRIYHHVWCDNSRSA